MVFSFQVIFINSKLTEGAPMVQLFATGIYTTIWPLPDAVGSCPINGILPNAAPISYI